MHYWYKCVRDDKSPMPMDVDKDVYEMASKVGFAPLVHMFVERIDKGDLQPSTFDVIKKTSISFGFSKNDFPFLAEQVDGTAKIYDERGSTIVDNEHVIKDEPAQVVENVPYFRISILELELM